MNLRHHYWKRQRCGIRRHLRMMYAAAGKNGIDLCPICCRQKHTDNNDRNRKRRKRYRGDHKVCRTPQNLLRGKGKRGDDTDHTNPLVGSAQTARKQAARPKTCWTGDQNACGGAIPARLRQRLDEGDLIGEVQRLIDSGIAPEDLIYYGLEYKFVTQHLLGELTRDELFTVLETAIHQFAKRQMTWFRGMERRGFTLHYIDGLLPREEQLSQALEYLEAWEQK